MSKLPEDLYGVEAEYNYDEGLEMLEDMLRLVEAGWTLTAADRPPFVVAFLAEGGSDDEGQQTWLSIHLQKAKAFIRSSKSMGILASLQGRRDLVDATRVLDRAFVDKVSGEVRVSKEREGRKKAAQKAEAEAKRLALPTTWDRLKGEDWL